MKHALIIEDEIFLAYEIEEILLRIGFTSIEIADTEEKALEKALAEKPNLIVSDYLLNKGTGVSAVEKIKTSIGDVPTIYVSATPDLCIHDDSIAILSKPLDDRKFINLINLHFDNQAQ